MLGSKYLAQNKTNLRNQVPWCSPLSLSQTFTILATIHHDSSRFELGGKIGVHQDGKKENSTSILYLTMLLRCLHDSSTVPLRFMTAVLRFTTVELRMLTMRPRFDKVLVLFKPVVPRHPPRDVFLMIGDKSGWIGAELGCQ